MSSPQGENILKTAVIYARVSTQSQVKGSGLDRQLRYGKLWCKQNNVEVVQLVVDVCSGYSGINLSTVKSDKKGNLGKLLRHLEEDENVTVPDYFVYESQDRIDRSWLHIRDINSRFSELGVETICTGFESKVDWSEDLSTEERTAIYM